MARTQEASLSMFKTPLGKSYLCPSPPVINLYDSKTKEIIVLRLANVQLQAFQIEKGKFAPSTFQLIIVMNKNNNLSFL